MGDLDPLTLQDWRRRVFELYAALRAAPDPALGWQRWRTERDALFAHHPATPLPADARDAFDGLPVYAYDPAARVLADAEPAAERTITLAGSAGATFGARRFATARFSLGGADLGLDLYWLEGYGGGLFVPFARRDQRRDDLRRRALPARHGQGRRPRDPRRPARARLQLRLQPVVRVRPALGCPLAPAG